MAPAFAIPRLARAPWLDVCRHRYLGNPRGLCHMLQEYVLESQPALECDWLPICRPVHKFRALVGIHVIDMHLAVE